MDWKTYAGEHALADFVPLEHEGARMLVRRGYEESARLLVEYKTLPAVETLGGGREALGRARSAAARHPVNSFFRRTSWSVRP